MNSTDKTSLRDKVMLGLAKAYEKLLEEKRKNNGVLVVMREGKIVHVKP